jgi:hypothetical protein
MSNIPKKTRFRSLTCHSLSSQLHPPAILSLFPIPYHCNLTAALPSLSCRNWLPNCIESGRINDPEEAVCRPGHAILDERPSWAEEARVEARTVGIACLCRKDDTSTRETSLVQQYETVASS